MTSRDTPRIETLADDAWLVRLGEAIDPGTLRRVHELVRGLRDDRPPGVVDIVPAYTSVGVFLDPRRTEPTRVRAWLEARLAARTDRAADDAGSRLVEIPVVYGGEWGPDLEDAAGSLGMEADALARRHASGDYTVAMIGFAPGFPYLAGLDPALALPRLATPRTHVPAGSVAIGGAQTGIYPRSSPGGWRILGRTPLTLFDPTRDAPALLQPGDRVRFRAIDPGAFDRLKEQPS